MVAAILSILWIPLLGLVVVKIIQAIKGGAS